MFTGLVEATGTLAARRAAGPGAILVVHCAALLKSGPLELGESIAVDGACLTVKRILTEGFEADVSVETLERTTLGAHALGGRVNLERSMPLGGRMGGHLVTGHVDATAPLLGRRSLGDAIGMTFGLPRKQAGLIAEKGSVAIRGVSLTVNAVRDTEPPQFDVVIVPHTRDATSLGDLDIGSLANIEVDLVARYVARLLATGARADDSANGSAHDSAGAAAKDAAWMERLTKGGYV